jgi:hypothetical protein
VSVPAASTVQVTVANGPGNPRDWVGLYATGGADTAYRDWMYLNGTRTSPTVGASSATLTFTMPLGAGTYEFRLFANGSYTRLATSAVVAVQ